MRGWQGFLVALLGLTLFEATVSSSTATQNAAGITALPAKFVAALTDPTLTIWGSSVPNVAGGDSVTLPNGDIAGTIPDASSTSGGAQTLQNSSSTITPV